LVPHLFVFAAMFVWRLWHTLPVWVCWRLLDPLLLQARFNDRFACPAATSEPRCYFHPYNSAQYSSSGGRHWEGCTGELLFILLVQ